MSEFVVSARKYRPVRFDEVVGQQHVSETLKNALRQNRLAHAFLFCGPRGVGKTTNARILAKVLNCLNVSDDFEPCNTCDNCVAFNQNASFNIFELDGASNNKVDHMHQLMEQVRIPPQSGKKKVYIIDEVHMLSTSAFNAFLKTLEEPPDYAVFILATTEKHKILPTILSRCQVYDFHRIRPGDMVAHLEEICKQEQLQAEPEALHLVAEKADGALRDALSIFDRLVSSAPDNLLSYQHAASQLNVLDHSTYFQVVDALLLEDVADLYVLFDGVLSAGFEPEPFLSGLAKHIRQLFVCKSPVTLKLLEVSESLRERYAAQAALCEMSFLINALNLAGECDFRLKQAANKRLHVELYLVKMAYAHRTVQAAHIQVDESLTQKKNSNAAVTASTSRILPATSGEKVVHVPATPKVVTNYEAPPPSPENRVAESTPAQPEERPVSIAPAGTVVQPSPAPPSKKAEPKRLSSVPSISFDDEEDEDFLQQVDPASLSLEQLQHEWDTTADQLPQRIASIMRRAKLQFVAPTLTARVGSLMAQNTLRAEAREITEIKERLNAPGLIITFEFDESLAPKGPPKKKVFGPKEKYQILIDTNPQVHTFRQRFGLELDE